MKSYLCKNGMTKEVTLADIESELNLRDFRSGSQITFTGQFNAVYGFGERFDAFNQIGLSRKIQVYETFTNQGCNTYLPVPFCLTDSGFGIYFDTMKVITISTKKEGHMTTFYTETLGDEVDIYFFCGTPADILDAYTQKTGRPKLPPDWAFGLWMSTHRWNSQELVLAQIDEAIKQGMKPAAVVIEAWSDEATFYRFDNARFPDPTQMINRFHEHDVKCILWQIPVLKKLEEGQISPEHDDDCAEAVRQGFVVLNPDGSPYLIPEGRWFGGSMIPDFTNPAALTWWFEKRQYLLDMGVNGFKTDGGEFIYDETPCFYDGSTGAEMQNGYALFYTQAYTRFIGEERVLFSRAGFAGSQATPLHWAGDQQSTWAELRHVFIAGLNAGLSGIAFWGFDIAGFAGKLPAVELYLRAFAFACFAPIMQWHSEPLGGQFAEVMASDDMVNDRSPWNIAARYNEPQVLEICRFYTEERKKLLPYILREAKFCSETGRPLMSPLFYDFHADKRTYEIDDQYMLGRYLLVAPILWEGITEREIYLPHGEWRDYWTSQVYEGGKKFMFSCELGHIPVFCFDVSGSGEIFHNFPS